MTLIEVIVVMVVLVILASFLVPAFIRKMDQVAGDQERASLKSFSDALQDSIRRNRYIPAHTNLPSVVARELGVSVTTVMTNLRNQPRVFLIDPALEIGVNGGQLPYLQNNSGSVVTDGALIVPPKNPRLLILSSIGRALPTNIVSGIPASTNDFNAIWDAGEGALPAGSQWTGWPGAGDLKIQRINLSPLFVHLLLNTYASAGLGRYSMDWITTNSVSTNAFAVEGYFIQNSILGLHTHLGVLDSQQVLIRDSSFVYNQNVWRGSIVGGAFPGGLDIGSVVAKFLAAPPNPNSQYTNQQTLVVQGMKNYMDAYEAWSLGVDGVKGTSDDFPSGSGGLRGTAITRQGEMMTAVQNLYSGSYYPAEIQCP